MIKSMTAFASAENTEDSITVNVEIRSYNSRYLDTLVKLPASFNVLEEPIKKLISTAVSRGRLEIRIGIRTEAGKTEDFSINEELADAYFNALQRLKKRYDLQDAISIDQIAGVNGVIEPVISELDSDSVWQVLQVPLTDALHELVRMREKEGQALAADFSERLEKIEDYISQIDSRTEGLYELYQQKLAERVASLASGIVEIDPARIAQEAAFMADKSDISEELVRAQSHIEQFRSLMDAPEPAGKPLNFLLQEFSREFNTMGSKAGNAEISHIIVAAKSELEKMREQVQNIE